MTKAHRVGARVDGERLVAEVDVERALEIDATRERSMVERNQFFERDRAACDRRRKASLLESEVYVHARAPERCARGARSVESAVRADQRRGVEREDHRPAIEQSAAVAGDGELDSTFGVRRARQQIGRQRQRGPAEHGELDTSHSHARLAEFDARPGRARGLTERADLDAPVDRRRSIASGDDAPHLGELRRSAHVEVRRRGGACDHGASSEQSKQLRRDRRDLEMRRVRMFVGGGGDRRVSARAREVHLGTIDEHG
jgi:hypothetical protein